MPEVFRRKLIAPESETTANPLDAPAPEAKLAPRISLAPLGHNCASDIFASFTDEVTRFMKPDTPRTVADSHAFISMAIEAARVGRQFHYAILTRNDAEFVGCCGLIFSEPTVWEIGIWIKQSCQNKGFGTEAIASLIEIGGGKLNAQKFLYPVDKRNSPSRRLAEAFGGVIVGERLIQRQGRDPLDEFVYLIPSRPASAFF